MHQKEVFHELIKIYVVPFFKKNGFKKSALNFQKTVGDIYYVVNFQNDTSNSYWSNRFYVNCGIHSTIIDEILGVQASLAPKYYECYYRDRINDITGSSYPYFDLKEDTDLEDVIISLMSDLAKLIFYFDSIKTSDDIMEPMITGQGMVKYEEVLRYIIRTNNLHRMGDYASKIYEVVPGLEERWPKFFKNKINQILKEEGVDKDLEDFRK